MSRLDFYSVCFGCPLSDGDECVYDPAECRKSMTQEYTIRNLTPHPIVIFDDDGNVQDTFPPEPGGPARVEEKKRVCKGRLAGCRLYSSPVYGDVKGLPEKKAGTYYIVSLLVAKACKGRKDLLVVAETVRDDKGRIIGCKGFSFVD